MNNRLLVVMPVYNSEKTLTRAISSILKQTYENLLLVIVDDCSTDGSFEIAQKFTSDPRVIVYRNNTNMGAYYSRNYGLYMAKDLEWDYFTTHDADDKSVANRYALLINKLKKTANILAIQDVFDRIDYNSKKLISKKLTIAHAVFKRHVFDAVGYFDNVRFGGDWEHWARLKAYCKLNQYSTAHTNQSLGISYIHNNNLTVLVPENSEHRAKYIEGSLVKIEKLVEKNKLHYSFNPKDKVNNQKFSLISKAQKKRKVTVVLLTWQRIANLKNTLKTLSNQTYKDFDIRITNANLKLSKKVDAYAELYKRSLNISVSHDGNDIYAFRRFTIGKELAESGTEIILFIDDDISFPDNYIEIALSQYEPKTYKSEFAWKFTHNGQNYYKYRKKIRNVQEKVDYCGTGVSMIDASIFLQDGLLNPPESLLRGALKIEDLWLSYYAAHVLKWKLAYMKIPNVVIRGADGVALYKSVLEDPYTKANFLDDLIKAGWKIKG